MNAESPSEEVQEARPLRVWRIGLTLTYMKARLQLSTSSARRRGLMNRLGTYHSLSCSPDGAECPMDNTPTDHKRRVHIMETDEAQVGSRSGGRAQGSDAE
uniref:Uncharacterized protein n=1 Tax=Rhodosorus marinus TaxID=101924 RepID=A0A7S3ECY4_9RHOD